MRQEDIITMDHPAVRMAQHIRESRRRRDSRAAWETIYRMGQGSVPVDFPGRDIDPGKAFSDILPDGSWAGRRCFIVGGGPSLKGFDFSRIKGELVIAVNASFAKVDAQVMVAMDAKLHDWIIKGDLGPDVRQAFMDFPGLKVWLDTEGWQFSPGVRTIRSLGLEGLSSSLRDGVYSGENSGYVALNVAACLGANPIYLLGFDGKTAADGRAHHHDEYPEATTQQVLDKFCIYFNRLAPRLSERGSRVVNLNPDSAVRAFEFGGIDDVRDLGKLKCPDRGYVVVSFYTTGTGYAQEVRFLEASLDRFRLPRHVFACAQTGTWRGNLNFKSESILKAFDMFPGKDIVFLDADAVVRRPPVLFDELSASHKYDLSAHFFKYRPESGDADELLSGTLWIQNNATGRALVERWHQIGLERPDVRHQMCLKAALEDLQRSDQAVRVLRHPFAYTCIYDYQSAKDVEPVIEHFQASRRFRKEVGFGQTLKHRRDQ